MIPMMPGIIRSVVTALRSRGSARVYAWDERAPEQTCEVHRTWGLRTGWVGQTRLKWVPCGQCTGGAQVLIRRPPAERPSWGPIPVEIRREMPDESGSSHANVRTCSRCHGINGYWAAIPSL